MDRILVTHPGRQHSHQLARALHEQNALFEYWTGVPSAPPSKKGLLYRLLTFLSPQPTLDLPASRIRHCYVEPLVRRVAEVVCSTGQATMWTHRAMNWFDRWGANRLPNEIDAVVGYENAARHTFQAAKKRDATTILDAASVHHRWQDEVDEPNEPERAHRRIVENKNREIALADHVLTVSRLARKSYLEAGLPSDQVTAVPIGSDLSVFTPKPSNSTSDDPFIFLFVGHARKLKGIDTLLASSDMLRRSGYVHRVHIAGGASRTFGEAFAERDHFERLGYLDRSGLSSAYNQADCLILPSRFDSFGRVVVEALATGLPAIVSDHVGAKQAITEGENGWVVPVKDVGALAKRMQWCVEHSERVANMKEAAVEAAQDYTWGAYRKRVEEVLRQVV